MIKCKITDRINNYTYLIAEKVTAIRYVNNLNRFPKIKTSNRIKSITGSIAIENNCLSLEQVTDVINNKRVKAPSKDILEAKNAHNAYECLDYINPYSIKDLLKVHSFMVRQLCKQAGMFRKTSVGVFSNNKPIHIAPKPEFVEELMQELFTWLKNTKTNFLVSSCIFHFNFEYIHPFADGNGRCGRLWQTAILANKCELFKWVPIEQIIFKNRPRYYEVLQICQQKKDCSEFVEFMLRMIYEALLSLEESINNDIINKPKHIQQLLKVVEIEPKSAKEIMKLLHLKNQPNFYYNYLKPALKANLIKMVEPNKPKSKHQKYYK